MEILKKGLSMLENLQVKLQVQSLLVKGKKKSSYYNKVLPV